MTALAKDKARRQETLKRVTRTLVSGTVAYKGARLVQRTDGKLQPATSTTGVIVFGIAAEKVDATSADKSIAVDLEKEVQVEWFANATAGDAVAAGDVGSDCYMLDDQTVTITPAGRSVAGKVWAVDSTKGVAVEKANFSRSVLIQPAVAAFASNDWAPAAAAILQDAVYDVPTTGAASTITLPAASPNGTRVTFVADGTKNGHTVQYRDATGPVNLTTALTASKRHEVVCVKRDGLWFANAYVSP